MTKPDIILEESYEAVNQKARSVRVKRSVIKKIFYFLENNMILINNLKQASEKNVALGGAQTLTSHSPGKHCNHLDHQLYMLLTVLNSPPRVYWSWSRTLTLCTVICSDSFI